MRTDATLISLNLMMKPEEKESKEETRERMTRNAEDYILAGSPDWGWWCSLSDPAREIFVEASTRAWARRGEALLRGAGGVGTPDQIEESAQQEIKDAVTQMAQDMFP